MRRKFADIPITLATTLPIPTNVISTISMPAQKTEVSLATLDDLPIAHEIMKEAAIRLIQKNEEMWTMANVAPEAIRPRIERAELYLFKVEGNPVGTVVFQLEDPIYWPEKPKGEAGY